MKKNRVYIVAVALASLVGTSVAEVRPRRGTSRAKTSRAATPAKRPPLTIRMKNPCAVTWSYTQSSEHFRSGAVVQIAEAGIPVARGDRDSLGNYVAKFSTIEDGQTGCHTFVRKSEYYSKLDLVEAMRMYSGAPVDGTNYAIYIHRRTTIPLHGKLLRAFTTKEWTRFDIAMAEWESGKKHSGPICLQKKPRGATPPTYCQ